MIGSMPCEEKTGEIISEENDQENPEPISLPSFSSVGIILIGVAISFLGPVITKIGALALVVLLAGFLLWRALSTGQYEKTKETYPGMKRSFWILNNLLYHLLIPALFFGAVYLYFRFVH